MITFNKPVSVTFGRATLYLQHAFPVAIAINETSTYDIYQLLRSYCIHYLAPTCLSNATSVSKKGVLYYLLKVN